MSLQVPTGSKPIPSSVLVDWLRSVSLSLGSEIIVSASLSLSFLYYGRDEGDFPAAQRLLTFGRRPGPMSWRDSRPIEKDRAAIASVCPPLMKSVLFFFLPSSSPLCPIIQVQRRRGDSSPMGDYYHPPFHPSSNPHVIFHPIQFDRAKLGDIFSLFLSLFLPSRRRLSIATKWPKPSRWGFYLPQLAWFIWRPRGWPIHANVINRTLSLSLSLYQMDVLCFSQHNQYVQERKKKKRVTPQPKTAQSI